MTGEPQQARGSRPAAAPTTELLACQPSWCSAAHHGADWWWLGHGLPPLLQGCPSTPPGGPTWACACSWACPSWLLSSCSPSTCGACACLGEVSARLPLAAAPPGTGGPQLAYPICPQWLRWGLAGHAFWLRAVPLTNDMPARLTHAGGPSLASSRCFWALDSPGCMPTSSRWLACTMTPPQRPRHAPPAATAVLPA